MTERHDVAGDPPSRGPNDRLERIRHHDRILPPQPHARPPVPSQFHPPILTQQPSPRIPTGREREAAPVQSSPNQGSPPAEVARKNGKTRGACPIGTSGLGR